jgi:hypothetical protein
MSLIRSTSNHDKIYAYHNISGHTCIHKGPELTITVLIEIFELAVNMWIENFDDEQVNVEGFSISEPTMNNGLLTVTLSYDGTEIGMSYVTFCYMIERYRYRKEFFGENR